MIESKRHKTVLLLFALILGLLCSGNSKIDYSAQHITVYKDNDIELRGDVIFQSADFKIRGNRAIIVPDSSMFRAFGYIVLTRGNNTVNGDSIYYDYKSNKGVIFGGDSKIDKGYFYGSRILTEEETVFRVSNGYFTTCEYIRDPHYRVFGSNITYYENDRVFLYPAVLYLKNVPVFALPFALIPAASTRKSGFLMPSGGYNALYGLFIKNLSYFWAVNDFSDMTFSADIYQTGRFLANYELRIIVKPYVTFNLNSTFAYDNSRRWSVQGNYSHALPWGIDLKSKWDYITDINIISDYSDTSLVNLKRTTETFVSLSKRMGKYSSYISFDYKKDFADSSEIINMPQYRGYFSRIRLFSLKYIMNSGLYYSHSHSFSNTVKRDSADISYQDMTVSNSFDTYYTLLRFISIKPYSSANYYRNSNARLSKAVSNYGVSATTQIYGSSLFGAVGFSKFRHTLIPAVSYRKTNNLFFDYSDFSNDSSSSGESVTVSLANNFEGQYQNSIKMLIKNTNSITYNLITDSLSLLTSSVQLLPSYPLNGMITLRYNVYTEDITYNINSSYRQYFSNPFHDGNISIAVSSFIDINSDSIIKNQISGSVSGNIGSYLNIRYNVLYDVLDRSIISSGISLNRDLHCWKANFTISTFGDNFKYDFSLSLKEMPEISIDKSLLGPLFL